MRNALRSKAAVVVGVAFGLVALGCEKAQWGLPRVAMTVESPRGAFTAMVRNHPEFDPPNQSLHLVANGAPRLVAKLAADNESCRAIAWASDGSAVAFVVEGQARRIVLVDLEGGQAVSAHDVAAGELNTGSFDTLRVDRRTDPTLFAICSSTGKCGDSWSPEPTVLARP
jgi:hypothetical protein